MWCERLARPAKAGHAGTLDPLATGVLVVCVGAATRLIEYVQRMPKRYRATFLLGRQSPTEDIEGEVAAAQCPGAPLDADCGGGRAVGGPDRAAAARLLGAESRRPAGLRAGPSGAAARAGAPAGRGLRLEVSRIEYPELVLRSSAAAARTSARWAATWPSQWAPRR